MKNIANILTVSRIILSVILLLFFHDLSPAFLTIFIIAMLTDLFDGMIARKTHSCSKFGSLLDTIADFLLDANLIKLVFTMNVMTKKLVIWMLLALGIGTLSPIINYVKHKKLLFIHSVPCKICMWTLFGVPFAIHFGFAQGYIAFVLTVLTFAMVELVAISIILKEPDPDARSFYSVLKQNKVFNY